AVAVSENKLIVLVLDKAGWHISGDLVVPKGIELAFLPAYTPELQPAEHLWPLAKEAVANKHFATLEDLDAALSERCRTLADMPEVIKAGTHFAWWPAVTPPSCRRIDQPDSVSLISERGRRTSRRRSPRHP